MVNLVRWGLSYMRKAISPFLAVRYPILLLILKPNPEPRFARCKTLLIERQYAFLLEELFLLLRWQWVRQSISSMGFFSRKQVLMKLQGLIVIVLLLIVRCRSAD